jgi:hypothetical protein
LRINSICQVARAVIGYRKGQIKAFQRVIYTFSLAICLDTKWTVISSDFSALEKKVSAPHRQTTCFKIAGAFSKFMKILFACIKGVSIFTEPEVHMPHSPGLKLE